MCGKCERAGNGRARCQAAFDRLNYSGLVIRGTFDVVAPLSYIKRPDRTRQGRKRVKAPTL